MSNLEFILSVSGILIGVIGTAGSLYMAGCAMAEPKELVKVWPEAGEWS